jgi:CRISPR-associated protein Cmr4
MTSQPKKGHDARLYFVHTLTPLHIGTGEAAGAVNLPTAKDSVTGMPLVPGSSLKGVLRAAFAEHVGPEDVSVSQAFGPSTDEKVAGRGTLSFSDARLLALPVRTLKGLFMWVTAPTAVRHLLHDMALAHHEAGKAPLENHPTLQLLACAPTPGSGDGVLVAEESTELHEFQSELWVKPGERIFLEERLVDAKASGELWKWGKWVAERLWKPQEAGANSAQARADQEHFLRRLVFTSDVNFGALCRRGLETRARVRIDEQTGTAARSGPWLEEHIPAETLLHGVVLGRDSTLVAKSEAAVGQGNEQSGSKPINANAGTSLTVLTEVLDARPILRLGGKASIGLGRARVVVAQ